MRRSSASALIAIALALPSVAWSQIPGMPSPNGGGVQVSLPLTGVAAYPAKSAGHFMRCRVNDAGTDWICTLTSDGSDVAVTAGSGGMHFGDCFGGTNNCLQVTANDEAPYIAGATATSSGLSALWATDDWTIRVTSYDSSGSSNRRVFSHGVANTEGAEVWQSPTQTSCISNYSGGRVQTNTTNGVGGGWNVATCTTAASNSRFARANGTTSAEKTTNQATVAPTADAIFGAFAQTGTNRITGYIYLVDFYSAAETDAQSATYEAQLWGTGGTQPVTVNRDTLTPCWHSGGYDVLGLDWPCVDSTRGMGVSEARTNYATESNDFTAWTVVNGAAVTADQASGPFAGPEVGAEADLLTDNGTSTSLIQAPAGDTTDGDWTGSVWAKQGPSTSPDFQLFINCSGGTGSGLCNFTGQLTTSWQRFECTQTCTGGTDRKMNIYPDTTGSGDDVYITGAQLEQSSYATPICLSSGAATTCDADVASVPTDGWPTAQGSISMSFTPFSDTPGADMGANSTLVDVGPESEVVEGWAVRLTNNEGISVLRRDSGGTVTFCTGAAQIWTAGTATQLNAAWGPNYALVNRDGARVVTCATTRVVTSIQSPAGLLQRDNGDRHINGWIKSLEIRK